MPSIACRTVSQNNATRRVEMRDAATQTEDERRRLVVKMLIVDLFIETTKRADLKLGLLDRKGAELIFFEKVWSVVHDIEFEVSAYIFEHFCNSVLEDLVKKLGNERTVLYHMLSLDSEHADFITDCFLENLLRPKHHSFMFGFRQYFRGNWRSLLLKTTLFSLLSAAGLVLINELELKQP